MDCGCETFQSNYADFKPYQSESVLNNNFGSNLSNNKASETNEINQLLDQLNTQNNNSVIKPKSVDSLSRNMPQLANTPPNNQMVNTRLNMPMQQMPQYNISSLQLMG